MVLYGLSRLDAADFSIRHLLQVVRSQFKDRVGSPRRRPNFFVLQEIFIEVRFNLLSMTDGRHAADGKASDGSREISVRFADGLATLAEQEIDIYLEIGPKPVLLGMAQAIFEDGWGSVDSAGSDPKSKIKNLPT